MTKRNQMTQRETILLGQFMERNVFSKGHLKLVSGDEPGPDAVVEYCNGWSDTRVLEELSEQIPGLKPSNVEGVRRSMYGNLRRGNSVTIGIKQRLQELEAKVAIIEKRLEVQDAPLIGKMRDLGPAGRPGPRSVD